MNLAILGAVAAASAAQATMSAPAPRVELALVAPTTHGNWIVRVTNDSPSPVRIVADLRLLSLDVTPRSSRAIHCELPADMRPEDDQDRRLLVPPGRSYAESFDPRLFCFGDARLDAIAPGAIVEAHLGWGKSATARSHLEVAPAPGVASGFAGLGRLDAPPIAVPDEPTAAPSVRAAGGAALAEPTDPDAPRLRLEGGRAVDAEGPDDAEIPVTIENRGVRPVTVRFRPETLAFDVEGPGGSEHCPWPVPSSATTVEALTTLAPRESATIGVLLASYCHGKGLARPGLLLVRPSLETTDAAGRDVDTHAFAGHVRAATPTLLRLRHASRYQAGQQMAPALEPVDEPDLRDHPQ